MSRPIEIGLSGKNTEVVVGTLSHGRNHFYVGEKVGIKDSKGYCVRIVALSGRKTRAKLYQLENSNSV